MKSKTRWIAVLFAVLAVAGLITVVLFNSDPHVDDDLVVRVGYKPNSGYQNYFVARTQRLFEKHGVTVEETMARPNKNVTVSNVAFLLRRLFFRGTVQYRPKSECYNFFRTGHTPIRSLSSGTPRAKPTTCSTVQLATRAEALD